MFHMSYSKVKNGTARVNDFDVRVHVALNAAHILDCVNIDGIVKFEDFAALKFLKM